MRRRQALHLLGGAPLLWACGSLPPDPDGGSIPVSDGAIFDGTLELGEGESAFRAITDGDTLLVARGCQGSQHVWMTLRARGLDPRGITVRLKLERSDGTLASVEFYVRLSFERLTDYSELRGLTLQIPMPDDVAGEDLLLTGELLDRAGHGARAERTVRVAWGTEVCGS